MSSDVAISVRDLNKIYGLGSKNEKVALNNISQIKVMLDFCFGCQNYKFFLNSLLILRYHLAYK